MLRHPPPQRRAVQLPRQLQNELNIDLGGASHQPRNKRHAREVRGGSGSGGGARGGLPGPGNKRQADGAGKIFRGSSVSLGTGHSSRLDDSRRRFAERVRADEEGERSLGSWQDGSEEEVDIPRSTTRETAASGTTGARRPRKREDDGTSRLKSILKPTSTVTGISPPPTAAYASSQGKQRSTTPELVLDRSSKTFRDRTAQDEAEISALEKKLGMDRTQKLPKSFDEDGLGDLLRGIGEEGFGEKGVKRKKDGMEWLENKRRRRMHEHDHVEEEVSETGFGREHGDGESEASDLLEEGPQASSSDEDGFAGFGASKEKLADVQAPRKRENPYIAPTSATAARPIKYVPPSLRKPTTSEAEASRRLQRQLQGHLNKLSEANLLSILAEVERLYQTNARQDVSSALIDLLLSIFCDPSLLQNTFVILHAAFTAAIYKVVGTDFGAEFVSQLVERFSDFHKKNEIQGGKQCVNLLSLLAHLYTFHMISCNLLFDHIRVLLDTLSEANAELLLRVVKDSGPQLRQDDPSSLKDIVLMMQSASAKAQAEGRNTSVRTKFMIETITDLKNNKLKTQIASSGMSSEHITRMRKVLGTLSSRSIRASEPLRFGIADLQNADRHGKWWLVGASWKEDHKVEDVYPGDHEDHNDGNQETVNAGEDLVMLARRNRMNTVVRRAIFVAIMSATDYKDAHFRLLKLRLKRSQEREIPRVLMHCVGAEDQYNPYYSLIAKTLCADRRLTMAFQFSLWAFFKRMGEGGDDLDSDEQDEDKDDEGVQLKEIVNTAKMFGHLITAGVISLGIVKTLNLFLVKEQAKIFVEVLLIVVILRSQEGEKHGAENRLADVFAKCGDSPQVIVGLRHFIKKVVRNTDLASTEAEAVSVRWGSGVALDTLRVVASGRSGRNGNG